MPRDFTDGPAVDSEPHGSTTRSATLVSPPSSDRVTNPLRPLPRSAGPATVLFLAARPSSTTALRLDVEAREIETQIKLARHRDAISFRPAWAVSRDDLLHQLNDKNPVVLHFSGHGSADSGLAFERADGILEWVSGHALCEVLRAAAPGLRLLILNSCYSAETVRVLRQQVPCTIGMSSALGDRAAIRYAAALYGALAFGKSIGQAHAQGLAALHLVESADQRVPELTCMEGVDPARAYLVERMLPPIGASLAEQVEFLRRIVRRDNLVDQLPPGLADEIDAADRTGVLLTRALPAQVYLLGQVGPEAARFPVLPGMVPFGSGTLFAWFSALQMAALRSPVTLGALLVEVRNKVGIDLPLCGQVLEMLCEKEDEL